MADISVFEKVLARRAGPARWADRAFWVIATYRLGRRIIAIRSEWRRRLLLTLFLPFARLVETICRMSMPVFAEIGEGLRISSCGMIFIHSNVRIGRNCRLSRGVTIGNAREGGPTPIVGDNVEIGAYAQILGGVRIGDGAKIASMSVVLKDVPVGAVAAGIPAKVRTGAQASVWGSMI